jgi:CBS domain containing-hemolysin-like protein
VASIALAPLVWLVTGFAGAMTRLLGTERERAFVTREELAALIEAEDEAPGKAEITEDERTMISNLLEMSDRTVLDIMVPLSEVTALPEDATLGEAALEVADKQHTRIPIYRSRVDDIVGVLHAFDLLRIGPDAKKEPVASVARPPTFVPESKRAVDLLVELQGTGNQLAVVVDEYGGAVGIVTVEDILEEIVGDIADEHDEAEAANITRDPKLGIVSPARTPVRELEEHLGLKLLKPGEEADIDTLGGLIFSLVGRVPARGELIRHPAGIEFEVLDADPRRVKKLRVHIPRAAPGDARPVKPS